MNSKWWVLLVACTLVFAALAGAAVWDDEILLSEADGVSSLTTWYNTGYNVAVDNRNRVHIVWNDEKLGSGLWATYYRRSTDGGLTWSPEVQLTDPTPGLVAAQGTRICADTFGRVHVAYLGNTSLIMYLRSPDGGVTWDPPREVSTNPGYQPRDHAIAADGSGRIHIAWTEDNTGGWLRDVFYRRSTDGGEHWIEPVINISNVPYEEFALCPSIATDLWDGVHISWHDSRNYPFGRVGPNRPGRKDPQLWGNFEIYYRRSTTGGEFWTDPVKRLTNDSAPSSGSCIAADARGWVHIAFHDERDPTTEVYYLRSQNHGADWSAETRLTYSDGQSAYPSIATDLLGRIHLIWLSPLWCFYPDVYYCLSPDGGDTWNPPYQAVSSDIGDDYASIAVDQVGGIHLVWERYPVEGADEVFYRRARPEPILGSTEPSQGRHLIRDQWTGNLHLVFHSNDDRVYYTLSSDNGYTWAVPQYLDSGKYPTICLVPTLMMSTVVCVAYKPGWEDCALAYKWFDPMIGQWQGDRINTSWYPGPPSMVTDGYMVHVAFRSWFLDKGDWNLVCHHFPYNDPNNSQFENIEEGGDPEQPCLAIDGAGDLHVAWRRADEDEVYYSKRVNGVWWPPEPVVQTPSFSTQPFVECYGDQVYVAWSDGLPVPSDVWRANRPLGGGIWNPINVSDGSPASESPTQAGSEFTTWAEGAGAATFDINYWSPVWGWGVVEPTAVCSYWPHSQMNYGFWGPNLWSAWTESQGLSQPPYYILTNIRSWGFIGGEGGAYYSASAGGAEPSRYCQKRDGVLRFGERAVDYSRDSLVYELPYLDPNYDYYLKVASYRETGNTWTQAISVDGGATRSVQFLPNRVDTAWLRIPPEAYIRDRRVKFSLKNVRGDYVTSLGLTLYQRDPKPRGKGGGQAGEAVSLPAREVFAVYPNPMKDQAQIEYSLKAASEVSLSVYDIMGRLVKTVVNGKQPAGVHRATWDGKAQAGLRVPGGVYLLKLNATGVTKTAKVIMVR